MGLQLVNARIVLLTIFVSSQANQLYLSKTYHWKGLQKSLIDHIVNISLTMSDSLLSGTSRKNKRTLLHFNM